jgi:nitrate reductase NapD
MTDNTSLPHSNTCNEYHVASFVAQPMMKQINTVKEAINKTAGAEIHAVSPEGKIVFTLEGKSQQVISQRIDELKCHGDLLSLSPVYHQYLSE